MGTRRLWWVALVLLPAPALAQRAGADLGVEISSPTLTLQAGGPLRYQLRAQNFGPALATDVTVVDFLPAGVIFAQADPGCSYDAALHRVRCHLPELRVEQARTLLVDVTIADDLPPGTALTNIAEISSASPDFFADNDRFVLTLRTEPAVLDLVFDETMTVHDEVILPALLSFDEQVAVDDATVLPILFGIDESFVVTDSVVMPRQLELSESIGVDVEVITPKTLSFDESVGVQDEVITPRTLSFDESIRVLDPTITPRTLTLSEVIDVVDMSAVPDCNENGIDDREDVARGIATDCDFNHVLDECERRGVGVIASDCDLNGVPDLCEISDGAPDCDANGRLDVCELDTDDDGTIDGCDACPLDPSKVLQGLCGCGQLDVDGDNDGVCDAADNCPQLFNPDQGDADQDGTGNACDFPSRPDPTRQDHPPLLTGVTVLQPPASDIVAVVGTCTNFRSDALDLVFDWDDGTQSTVVRNGAFAVGHRYTTARAREVQISCCDRRSVPRCDEATVSFTSGGAPDQCPQSPDDCVRWEWNPQLSACVEVTRPNGARCDDGQFCTVLDACVDGECRSAPRNCGVSEPCLLAECDESNQSCVQIPVADGEPCDDGQTCTLADTCENQICVGAEPDADDDGAGACSDCDDADAASAPRRQEICDDGRDNDCDGLKDGADPDCGAPEPELELRLDLQGPGDTVPGGIQVSLVDAQRRRPRLDFPPAGLKKGRWVASILGLAPGTYFVVVTHTNHLRIRSVFPLHLDGRSSVHLDLADPANVAGVNTLVCNGAPPCAMRAGDIDQDGVIDARDQALLTGAWLSTDPAADLDGDGVVFMPDYLLWKSNFRAKATPLP